MDNAARGNAIQEQHDVATEDIPFEFMMNALRLTNGFPVVLFQERAGIPWTSETKSTRRSGTARPHRTRSQSRQAD